VAVRLVRHGASCDFIAVWEDAGASKAAWEELIDVPTAEVRASRLLLDLLGGDRGHRPFRLLHRPLLFK
jgi:hypothetical protein